MGPLCYIHLTHVSEGRHRREATFEYDRFITVTEEIAIGRGEFLPRFVGERKPPFFLCEVGCRIVTFAAACGGVGAEMRGTYLFAG